MIPKFRAFIKDTKQMIDVEFLDLSHKVLIGKHWEFGMTEAIKFDDVDIMQSTGVMDEEGVKELYRDDIVLLDNQHKAIVCYGRHLIDFNDKVYASIGFYLKYIDKDVESGLYPYGSYKILGNIHEHSHLLEEVPHES